MKFLTSIFLFISFCAFSQGSFPKTWKTGKSLSLFDHNILREAGSGRSTPYIYYKTLDQLKKEYRELSVNQMWPSDSLEVLYELLNEKAKGGVIGVKLVANKVETANTKNLTLIIQNNDGKELQRKELDSNIPSVSSAGGAVICTSYALHYIPFELNTPFRVFLINRLYSDPKYSQTIYLIEN